MRPKTIAIPTQAAKAFLRYRDRYFAETNEAKQGEIAVLAMRDLLEHLPDGYRLKHHDVIELFNSWKD